jgi:hypothetical protein
MARSDSAGKPPAQTQERSPRIPREREAMPTLPTSLVDQVDQETRRRAAAQWIDAYGASLLAAPDHTLWVPMTSGRSFSLRLRRGNGLGGMEPSRYTSLEPADHFAVTKVDRYSGTLGEGVPLVGALKPILPVNASATGGRLSRRRDRSGDVWEKFIRGRAGALLPPFFQGAGGPFAAFRVRPPVGAASVLLQRLSRRGAGGLHRHAAPRLPSSGRAARERGPSAPAHAFAGTAASA